MSHYSMRKRDSKLLNCGLRGVAKALSYLIKDYGIEQFNGSFPKNLPSDTVLDKAAENNGFMWVDVFGGNSRKNLEAAKDTRKALRELKTKRPITYALETDVRWVNDNGKPLIYCEHNPLYQFALSHTPHRSAKEIAQRESRGKCLTLESLEDMKLCFDIKIGNGSEKAALEKMFEQLGDQKDRSWFYSYNMKTLAKIAEIDPTATLSLRAFNYSGKGDDCLVPYDGWAFKSPEELLRLKADIRKIHTKGVTITAAANTDEELINLKRDMDAQGRHLIFATFGEDMRRFEMAYGGLAMGAYMNKLRFPDVKHIL